MLLSKAACKKRMNVEFFITQTLCLLALEVFLASVLSYSLFVHSKTSQRTNVCSSADSEPPTTSKGSVDKEGVNDSSTSSWARHNTSAISQGNVGLVPSIHAAEPVVTSAGKSRLTNQHEQWKRFDTGWCSHFALQNV